VKPLVFVFPYAVIFWAVFVWAFSPEFAIIRRSGKRASDQGSPDAGSLRAILLGMNLAYVTAFPLAWVPSLQVPAPLQRVAYGCGIAILIAGSLLRRHCWRMLGAHFTGDVRAQKNQPVVTTGAYALLRHPSYTAGILMNMGIGVALGSWASALLLTAVSLLVYGYRIKVEERALLAAIGEPYREFMRTRKRLIPFVY